VPSESDSTSFDHFPVKVDLHRSMAVALMALVELRLVVAVMVADLMPWLLGAVRRHGGDYL